MKSTLFHTLALGLAGLNTAHAGTESTATHSAASTKGKATVVAAPAPAKADATASQGFKIMVHGSANKRQKAASSPKTQAILAKSASAVDPAKSALDRNIPKDGQADCNKSGKCSEKSAAKTDKSGAN